MAIVTTQEISPVIEAYYDGMLIENRHPYYVYDMFGQKIVLPANHSDTVKFRRIDELPVSTAALSEAVTPDPISMSKFDTSCKLEQHGAVIVLSDKVQIIVENKLLNDAAERLNRNLYAVRNTLIRDMLKASASQFTCTNGSTTVGGVTNITEKDIDLVVDYLETNNVRKLAPAIPASQNVSTAPVWDAYWGLSHRALRSDFKKLNNFEQVSQYSREGYTFEAEYGSTDEVRWLLTTECYVSGGVYYSNIIGENAYGVVEITGEAASMYIQEAGEGDDVLHQRTKIGYKTYLGTTMIDDACAATVLSVKAA